MKEFPTGLIFCEGPHDIAFIRLVLSRCFGFGSVSWKFSEYPAPFNLLFPTKMEQHAGLDLRLDFAHKFFLPDKVLKKDNQLMFLFNIGGASFRNEESEDKVKMFLSEFLTLLSSKAVFPGNAAAMVGDVQYLFTFDADHLGVDKVRRDVLEKLRMIDNKPWFDGDLKTFPDNPFAAECGKKGIYIWAADSQMGTLEDVLMPLFQESRPELMEQAESAIDDMFTWDTKAESLIKAVSQTAKRRKSIITLSGQGETPGSSMNVVLDRAKIIDENVFKQNPAVQNFATFLARFFDLQPS